MKFLITGGAGFIGSAVIRYLISNSEHSILNLDKLTYAGNLKSLDSVVNEETYSFIKADINNRKHLDEIFSSYEPDIVMHLAAESHVDRSIDSPKSFIETNIIGTYNLLEAARQHYEKLPLGKKSEFRFHHISTDEVYGDLYGSDSFFSETTPYDPSSPYSASKAGSDHLVRAWHRTFGLPIVITNCSNNYGPYQLPEKLIPRLILNALSGQPMPIYGNGQQIRDWLYVEDHARALVLVATHAEIGKTYNIGGKNEKTNIEVAHAICQLLEEALPNKPQGINMYRDLITFVSDRPGHDFRYAVDATKICEELGWRPCETFETGLRKTISWYLNNHEWSKGVIEIQ